MNSALTAVLGLIQQILPLVTSGAASTGVAGSIVSTLTTWLPLVTSLTEDLYTPVKNIITVLQQSGALTDQQIADLKALDKQVDDAFDAASAGLDPDAP